MSAASTLDSFKLWMEQSRYDCLTVSETWLYPLITNSMLDIAGYDSYRLDRSSGKKSRGGGLLTLFWKRDDLLVNDQMFQHISSSNPYIEVQFLEVKIGKLKKMILANCYRPPSGKINEFFDFLHESLDQIPRLEEYEIFLCGNLNIPYGDDSSGDYVILKTLERKYSLVQLIKSPTRTTARTSTILDLILTNSRYIQTSDTEEINMSDHEPVFAIRKKHKSTIKRVDFECRCFSNFIKEDFQAYLVNRNWESFYHLNDVDTMWDTLRSIIHKTADYHCPLKRFRGKKELPPWLTVELHELMFERDLLYKKAKKSKLDEDWVLARRIRNLCNSSIRQAKNNYTKTLLETYEKDPYKFWRTIESVWCTGKGKSDSAVNLVDQGTGVQVSPDEIPNFFNEHLRKVGSNLA